MQLGSFDTKEVVFSSCEKNTCAVLEELVSSGKVK